VAIVAFEKWIAEASWSRAQIRADDVNHRLTVAKLQRMAPGFAWKRFLHASRLGDASTVLAVADTSLPKLAAIFATTPIATLKAWQAFHTIDNAAPYLSKAFVDARFEFRSRQLAGQQAIAPRWRGGVDTVDAATADAIGRLYVAAYFPPASEAPMAALVANLRQALSVRIELLPWMTPATKAAAQKKLAASLFKGS
jgi:putative endopeptidase